MIKEKIANTDAETLVNSTEFAQIESNMISLKKSMAYYRCAIMEAETKFKVLNEEFSLEYDRNPIETIKTRLKSTESIIKKLVRKNLPVTVNSMEDNLNDIAGVRVICSFIEDIYLLANCLLNQDDVKLIQVKDYIKNPKPNGYRSLHLIIEIPIFLKEEKKNMRVEVQLRTIAMDFWASLDHKLSYKKDISDEEARLLRKELLECAQISADLDVRMENIKNRIVNKEY